MLIIKITNGQKKNNKSNLVQNKGNCQELASKYLERETKLAKFAKS